MTVVLAVCSSSGELNLVLSNVSFTTTPIELVIFDCDGVLVDSEVLSERQLLLMLSELGVNVSEEYFNAHFLGHSFEHVTTKILTDFSVELPSDFRQNYQQVLMRVFSAELKATPHIEHVLSQLSVPYCLASSSSPERVARALEITELIHFFSGRMFTSSQVNNGKPAPDLFLYAAEKMNVSPKNCLVVEDSQAGIQAAIAANMQLVQYLGASHLNNRSVVNPNTPVDVVTIHNWQQLFELAPSLNSSL